MDNTAGRTLQTTSISLEVVEMLRELDGGRVTELADELELAPSTVHSHLSTLLSKGYAVKQGDEYYLSLRFLDHGDYVRNRKKSYRVAASYTEQLAKETDCRAVFAVMENGRGVYIHTSSGKHAVWTYSTVGKQFYLHQTASGKSILSRFSRSHVIEIIEQWGLPAATDHTITDPDTLLEQLETIRERGIAFNYEEQLDGIKAVGVPVNGPDDRVVGAFSVASPANRLTDDQFEEDIPNTLLGVANEFELEISMS
ncbi:IclR family transcriptional regulator [Natronorubrum thiooxidans]|uniref:Transcriptional regulator, IclR family n=1 Tax=Natronorubrum thiooxidans TaxID=308853 RepID=A0A1N7H788_9EURY|nr:IclR family transcriptional regulator [Natronorubrum thiooxidans]SIS20570.1 transcriptional regulator, IclR family [Natronorubrum thiooxidans]